MHCWINEQWCTRYQGQPAGKYIVVLKDLSKSFLFWERARPASRPLIPWWPLLLVLACTSLKYLNYVTRYYATVTIIITLSVFRLYPSGLPLLSRLTSFLIWGSIVLITLALFLFLLRFHSLSHFSCSSHSWLVNDMTFISFLKRKIAIFTKNKTFSFCSLGKYIFFRSSSRSSHHHQQAVISSFAFSVWPGNSSGGGCCFHEEVVIEPSTNQGKH